MRSEESILEIALDTQYESHEGYTRAFSEAFHITPNQYRKEPVPIPLFVQYPIRAYYTHLYQKEMIQMNKEALLCMVSAVDRPRRKLILLRSTQGHDYWSFCEEMGCGWKAYLIAFLINLIPQPS
ncbi:hypothetical protein D3C78_1659730 [compost metagenome]